MRIEPYKRLSWHTPPDLVYIWAHMCRKKLFFTLVLRKHFKMCVRGKGILRLMHISMTLCRFSWMFFIALHIITSLRFLFGSLVTSRWEWKCLQQQFAGPLGLPTGQHPPKNSKCVLKPKNSTFMYCLMISNNATAPETQKPPRSMFVDLLNKSSSVNKRLLCGNKDFILFVVFQKRFQTVPFLWKQCGQKRSQILDVFYDSEWSTTDGDTREINRLYERKTDQTKKTRDKIRGEEGGRIREGAWRIVRWRGNLSGSGSRGWTNSQMF